MMKNLSHLLIIFFVIVKTFWEDFLSLQSALTIVSRTVKEQ